MIELSSEQILASVPHRQPLLLLSGAKVVEYLPDGAEPSAHLYDQQPLHAWWQVPEHSWVTEGHFPNNPLVPGVLVIEAMAQSACLLARCLDPDSRNKSVIMVSLNRARFLAPIRTPVQIDLFPTLKRIRAGVRQFEAYAEHGGEKVATVELMAQVPPPNLEPVGAV